MSEKDKKRILQAYTMLRKQKMIYIAAFGILLTISLILLQIKPAAIETFMIAPPPISTYATTVAARGLVEAADDNVVVGIEIPGVIKEMYVKVWQEVKKGDKLLLIDDDDLRAQIEVQKRIVLERKVTFDKNKAELARMESITDPRAIAAVDLDDKRHDVAFAREDLKVAIKQLKEMRVLLDKHTVYAPRDGRVIVFNPRVGEYVDNSSPDPQIMVGTPGYQVRVDVDEVDAAKVRPDAAAIGYPKSLKKPVMKLTFSRIEPYCVPKVNLSGSSDERTDTRVLQVIYAIQPDPSNQIYVGQQIDVYIDAEAPKG
jgi:multidrug efflux pump subunit AcrA (membrane-fusion protein)